jgi:hypothetical protein
MRHERSESAKERTGLGPVQVADVGPEPQHQFRSRVTAVSQDRHAALVFCSDCVHVQSRVLFEEIDGAFFDGRLRDIDRGVTELGLPAQKRLHEKGGFRRVSAAELHERGPCGKLFDDFIRPVSVDSKQLMFPPLDI